MKDWNSLLGGYSCLVIGVTGTLVNVMVLVVLTSETKLSSQPTTAILVVITLLNILYNGLILPAQAVMYLERRWAVTVLSALYDISLSSLFSHSTLWCQMFAFSFYAHMGSILFAQCVLAVSRFLTVCTQTRSDSLWLISH